MTYWTCPLPQMPEHRELKEAFEHKIYPSTLTGWGHYFTGMGALEEIDDLEACLAGNTTAYRSSLNTAGENFRFAKDHLQHALDLCTEFRALLPESTRKMLSPNIKVFYEMITLLDEAEMAIRDGGIPTLECLHRISELIREDMVFGERMARVNRGTEGHFPYPDDELVEVLGTLQDSTV